MRRSGPFLVALLCMALSVGAGTATATARAEEPEPSGTSAQPASPPKRLDSQLEPNWFVPSLHALALMTGMRASEAYLWPEPFADTRRLRIAFHYREAFSKPPRWESSEAFFEQDGDRWQINVIGHGLFGSELYLRARTCRLPTWQALLLTGLASTTWEYGFEASGVRPSGLDLLYTPLAGLVLGEGRYFAWSKIRRLPSGAGRTLLSALLDPLGDLERALGSPC